MYYELGIAHMVKPVATPFLGRSARGDSVDLRHFRHIIYKTGKAGLGDLSAKLAEAVTAVRKPVHRIYTDIDGNGSLAEKLMGPDHCLYEFRIESAFTGHRAAKFLVSVVRHIMAERPKQEVVCRNGMGLNMGERRRIDDNLPGWEISLESRSGRPDVFKYLEPADWCRSREARTCRKGHKKPARASPTSLNRVDLQSSSRASNRSSHASSVGQETRALGRQRDKTPREGEEIAEILDSRENQSCRCSLALAEM